MLLCFVKQQNVIPASVIMEDTVIHNQHTRIFIVGVHGLLLKKDVEEIQVSSYLIE